MKPIQTDPELLAMLERWRKRWNDMSPAARDALIEAQRRSWVAAEISWDEDATVIVGPSK